MQTIKQAMVLARTGKSQSLARAAHVLSGLPVGGWAETRQAMRSILNDLPLRQERSYTVAEFVDAAYVVRNDRYHARETE